MATLSCAAIPGLPFAAELFGYGPALLPEASPLAKTGLGRTGERGNFLDEGGAVSLQVQAGLLPVNKKRQFYKVGGEKPKKIDLRVVTATSRDLKTLSQQGPFRKNPRSINIVEIVNPPLRAPTGALLHWDSAFRGSTTAIRK